MCLQAVAHREGFGAGADILQALRVPAAGQRVLQVYRDSNPGLAAGEETYIHYRSKVWNHPPETDFVF